MPLRRLRRLKEAAIALRPTRTTLFLALRQKWREGYTFADFRSDLMAGTVVAMVAIPLAMALAIASGVAPQAGLYTVMIAGVIVALLGGSRCQVSGPTAAFVVILAPIAQRYGFAGLLLAGMIAGVILLAMGLARMGRLVEFIPHPVTVGFTAGIAVVIATLQLKDFFGLRIAHMPENYPERVVALFHARTSADLSEFIVGALTLAVLIFWPRVTRKVPGPLVALTLATIGVAAAEKHLPGLQIATIGTRFHGIPQAAPTFTLPWLLAGPNGQAFPMSLHTIRELIPSAFAIAVLGAVESLLSAVVADGMSHSRHDPDSELVALGVGNVLCPFFGGVAATGAIARTATNIRYGARSPIASVTHALVTLAAVLLFAPYVSYLPMAAMAALLLLVAYNMSEARHFVHILKVAPRSDVIVLLLCFGLTVIFDMVVGVTVGVVLAALLFMRRMASVTSGHALVGELHPRLKEPLPRGVILYEITGPLFFGAADNAVDAIELISADVRVVIFDMEDVPVIDVTGLVAFESALNSLIEHEQRIILSGIQPGPHDILSRAGMLEQEDKIRTSRSLEEAVALAKAWPQKRLTA